MYTNTSITLYLASNNYTPLVIPHAFMTIARHDVVDRQGHAYTEEAQVIFKGDKAISFTPTKDFVIDGVSEIHESVDLNTEKGRHDLYTLLKNSGAFTVMNASYKSYGSTRMRHWELSCR